MKLTKRAFYSYIAALCMTLVMTFGTVRPYADDNGNNAPLADDNGNRVPTPTSTLVIK